jgi:hypothetical protein
LHNWAWRFDQTSDSADVYKTIECLACGVSISRGAPVAKCSGIPTTRILRGCRF